MKRNEVDSGWSERKGTSELNDAERPARGAEHGIPGRGHSQCKGPGAGAVIRPLWLELREWQGGRRVGKGGTVTQGSMRCKDGFCFFSKCGGSHEGL